MKTKEILIAFTVDKHIDAQEFDYELTQAIEHYKHFDDNVLANYHGSRVVSKNYGGDDGQ